MPSDCMRCHRSFSLFAKLSMAGKEPICSSCEQEIVETIERIHRTIIDIGRQGRADDNFEQWVHQELAAKNIPAERVGPLLGQLTHYRNAYETQVVQVRQRNAAITRQLEMQQQKQQEEKVFIESVRQGRLPKITVSKILDTDETAHMERSAIYYKPGTKITPVHGKIIATNKRLCFVTPDRNSMEISWNNIAQVSTLAAKATDGKSTTLVHIEVWKGQGGGNYAVEQPEIVVAVIETAVLIWKRYSQERKEQANNEPVPEHVKAAVFQRDKGRCRECGYEDPYIEYDHIYPRSKGGQNTVENIQLLCRGCNRKKGAKVQLFEYEQ